MDDRYFTPSIPNGWFQIAASDEIKPGDGPIGIFRRWCTQFYTWPDDQQAAQ